MAEYLVLQRTSIRRNGEQACCNASCDAKWGILYHYGFMCLETASLKCKEVGVGVGLATLYVEAADDVVLGKQSGEVALYAVEQGWCSAAGYNHRC